MVITPFVVARSAGVTSSICSVVPTGPAMFIKADSSYEKELGITVQHRKPTQIMLKPRRKLQTFSPGDSYPSTAKR
jgi:hypothetical protein